MTNRPICRPWRNKDFNPHHPCGWWRYKASNATDTARFQSTPPVWVVTWWVGHISRCFLYFNPHHPCGWWPLSTVELRVLYRFQSTPPVWVVTDPVAKANEPIVFQSTPPVWVVTGGAVTNPLITNNFNPHHPCGWWLAFFLSFASRQYISIHTTRVGGDRKAVFIKSHSIIFQSTPPVWVVTTKAHHSVMV